jgi:hypothetical protein
MQILHYDTAGDFATAWTQKALEDAFSEVNYIFGRLYREVTSGVSDRLKTSVPESAFCSCP